MQRDGGRRVVVITGASSGFGKGTARKLAAQGCSVVLIARREHLLAELAREIEGVGGRALAVAADVSRREDVQRAAEEALREFGRIDVWINDAGVGVLGRFEEVPVEDHVQVIGTNLIGTIYGSHVALTQFRNQGHGGILINVASAFGKMPSPYYASYVASKHGVVGLGSALRQELKECGVDNVHVCTVMPMAMDTPFFDHVGNYTGRRAQPVPPLYDPAEVVDTLVKLVHEPQDEVIVGGAGKVFNAAHHLFPSLIERFYGRQTHKVQMEDSPRTDESTSGAVHQPMRAGTEVKAGRMEAEGGAR